jgi:hypothetical protein
MGCGCGGNKNLGGARNMRRVGGGPFTNVVRTESANPPAPAANNNNVVIPNNFTERERIQRLRRAAIERATGKKMF